MNQVTLLPVKRIAYIALVVVHGGVGYTGIGGRSAQRVGAVRDGAAATGRLLLAVGIVAATCRRRCRAWRLQRVPDSSIHFIKVSLSNIIHYLYISYLLETKSILKPTTHPMKPIVQGSKIDIETHPMKQIVQSRIESY